MCKVLVVLTRVASSLFTSKDKPVCFDAFTQTTLTWSGFILLYFESLSTYSRLIIYNIPMHVNHVQVYVYMESQEVFQLVSPRRCSKGSMWICLVLPSKHPRNVSEHTCISVSQLCPTTRTYRTISYPINTILKMKSSLINVQYTNVSET